MFTGFACWWDFFTKLFENRRARFGKVYLRGSATQRTWSTAGSHDNLTEQAMFTGFACWWDFFTKLFENRRARFGKVFLRGPATQRTTSTAGTREAITTHGVSADSEI
jgi:hypothetical protein